ncbi:hypothetical protein RN2511_028130 [Rhodococcus sp. NKCM2511]|nr:hypothetical protein RN2511_028130 [Rhodococcus sp. NKCM2511]
MHAALSAATGRCPLSTVRKTLKLPGPSLIDPKIVAGAGLGAAFAETTGHIATIAAATTAVRTQRLVTR